MDNTSLVSIVIPCYNVQNYLRYCLDSVITQSYQNLEIICVNDGSTDDTQKILESYALNDIRIKIINQENRGLGAARNVGMDVASGKYISFIDSDDWINEVFIEKLVDAIESTYSDIAVGNIIQAIPDVGCSFDYQVILNHDDFEVSCDGKMKYKLAGVFKHNYVWNKLYNLDMLRHTKVRFEEGIIFEDLVFTNKVIYYMRKLVTTPLANYYYRKQKLSLMWGKSDKWLKDFNQAQQRALRFRQSINPEIEDITEFDWTEIVKYKFYKWTILTVKTYGLSKLYYLFDKFLVFQKDVKRRMYLDEKSL